MIDELTTDGAVISTTPPPPQPLTGWDPFLIS